MVPVVETVCAGVLYVENVQLALALVTDLNLVDARFYIQYHPVLLQQAVAKILIYFWTTK